MSARAAKNDKSELSVADVARFTTIVAILAIFIDAALGHGLTWENDPYWTYWVTKTFLIASIFGLGTAWMGIGIRRGAIITAIHTLVLTVYYWSFSPIGLPSSPEWLDLEHTWISGLPIHFGVIYLGYLITLWLWRRRQIIVDTQTPVQRSNTVLITSGMIVVLAGGTASIALGEFPGFTWFLVRLLLTIPFLLWWWAWAGRDRVAAVTGGVILALIWTTYGHFLGPSGLPDASFRILSANPPPAAVEFMDYRQLWLISLPIYTVVMSLVLLAESARKQASRLFKPVVGLVAISLLYLLIGINLGGGALAEPARANLTAEGEVQIETGAFYSNHFNQGSGSLEVYAKDIGGRVTPLPPRDEVSILAAIKAGEDSITITASEPLVNHPMGKHTTWWGVGLDVSHHGESGIGTSKLPPIESKVAVFAIGTISRNGQVIANGVPIHVMTAENGLPNGGTLELDVGMEDINIPGLPTGHLRAIWQNHAAYIQSPETRRYAFGGVTLVGLLLATLGLVKRDPLIV